MASQVLHKGMLLFIVVGLLCTYRGVFAASSGVVNLTGYVDATYRILSSLPGSVSFPDPITNANKGSTAELGPYETRMYMNTSTESYLRVTVTADHSYNGQAYLRLTGAATNCGVDANQEQTCIPYTLVYTTCYNSDYPAPFNTPIVVSLAADSSNLIPAANSVEGTCVGTGSNAGELVIRRDTLTTLPEAGTYTGTVTISVGPE